MKKNILNLMKAVICLAVLSCSLTLNAKDIKGNGKIVTRQIEISAFDGVSTSLPATINFTLADKSSCSVRTDENLFEYLNIRVEGDDLCMDCKRIGRQYYSVRPTEFVINITAPSLEEINLAGSGDFNVLSAIKASEMDLNVAGSGDIIFKKKLAVGNIDMNVAGSGSIYVEAPVACEEFGVNVAGSGEAVIGKGNVKELNVNVAGSGSFESYAEVEVLDANMAGSGDITAKVNRKLYYAIIGSGDINYYGDPVLEGETLGSGSLNKLKAMPSSRR
ncbi:MAG: DUF2807 domain-containing protein [Bacteroidales bacterium]|nr:DUF2807 domain-containing protein [Bacteroidales bacterium]